jgi:hypothetical protein
MQQATKEQHCTQIREHLKNLGGFKVKELGSLGFEVETDSMTDRTIVRVRDESPWSRLLKDPSPVIELEQQGFRKIPRLSEYIREAMPGKAPTFHEVRKR